MFDAHRAGAPVITRALEEAAALAKALSRRELVRRGEAAASDQERIQDMLIGRLQETLPGFEELRVSVLGQVGAGLPLRRARDFADWISSEDIARLETPGGLPRQPLEAVSPGGLWRVEVECDEGGFHDSRNTWYRYNGYQLTLLVWGHDGEIWDARWERTD